MEKQNHDYTKQDIKLPALFIAKSEWKTHILTNKQNKEI